ncbi:hypothetical protein WMY93_002611 [Mugilogobius chulae]|uniref:Endoplasmic reticulum junction formation protein lunapark n=1 Tax=Mugilogobius chulae TaxID=88201 RepID=A0AAW0PVZ7_9GOBI
MGGLLSRWRTKQSTVEVLEGLEKEIQVLEEYSAKNQRQLKIWVGRLLLYSSVLYLLTCLVVYFWYLPEQLMGRLILCLPLLFFPLLVWLFRKFLVFVFLEEQREILEEVMETETYKTAKMILERFDPDSKKNMELESSPAGPMMTPKPGQELRHRSVMPKTPTVMVNPGNAAARPPAASGPTHSGRASHSAPAAQQSLMRRPVTPGTPVPGLGMHPPGPPLARPVLPRERGAVDRVIEYLVGDGPGNRYALICQQCLSHNGMALKEEFEYIAFRCAYCYFLNPAKKTRPQAPRLPESPAEHRMSPAPQSSLPSAVADEEVPVLCKLSDGSDEAEPQEPETPTSEHLSASDDGQTSPESQEVPSEKSDTEHDESAMEVE